MGSLAARHVAFSAALVSLGAASVVPWARSGSRSRNSYSLFAIAERLDLVSGPAATAARWWPLVPGSALATVALLAFGYRRFAALMAAVVALVALVAVNTVAGSPLAGEFGLWLTGVSATVVLAFGLTELALSSRRSTSQPTPGVHDG